MRKLLFGLVVFSAAILLSSGFPVEKENGDHQGVIGPEASRTHEIASLSKRKPPARIPGPKLNDDEKQSRSNLQSESIQHATQYELLHEESEEKKKSVHLTEDRKGKHDTAHMASMKKKENGKENDKEEKEDKEDKDDKDEKGKGKGKEKD